MLVGVACNFSFEQGLVGQDVALPLGHRLILAHPDLVGHLIDETKVVADEYEAALEAVERVRQSVDRLNVQVVSRLVQQQPIYSYHTNRKQIFSIFQVEKR